MIKKKCNECGTMVPTNRSGECAVCTEDDWSMVCEKHPTQKLVGTSKCRQCEEEKSKPKDGPIEGAGGPQVIKDEETTPASGSDDSCCGCIVIIAVIYGIYEFLKDYF